MVSRVVGSSSLCLPMVMSTVSSTLYGQTYMNVGQIYVHGVRSRLGRRRGPSQNESRNRMRSIGIDRSSFGGDRSVARSRDA